MSKVDILAIGVHPDDIELCAGGTVLKHIDLGYTVAICDLTRGELGTRGNGELRLVEAEKAAAILGVTQRVNLGMEDGFFDHSKENILQIIQVIRHFRPKIVLNNALHDRHPDHGRASKLVRDACFYAGLLKIETHYNGAAQQRHRPDAIYHYIQDKNLNADFVIDITKYMDKKLEAIMAYKSQFFDPENTEPATPISSLTFMEFVKAKNRSYAREINVEFAEGFNVDRLVGVNDLFDLI